MYDDFSLRRLSHKKRNIKDIYKFNKGKHIYGKPHVHLKIDTSQESIETVMYYIRRLKCKGKCNHQYNCKLARKGKAVE